MKPDVDKLLEVVALDLMTRVAPTQARSYEQSSVGAAGAMLLALREEFDRAASRRIEENRAIRELFRNVVECLEDPALEERVVAAAADSDDDHRVSALEEKNAALRGLLIEVHARVETLDTPAARSADEAIWRELAHSTERRRFSFSVF